EMRRELSTTLRARSIDAHRAEWEATIAGIAASPKYAGLRIKPQIGLVPLGPDPASGLFEFAHLGSGEVPLRDPGTGRLVLGDRFAIILVLVPGGTFRMGAQSTDPGAPNFDPQAEDDESPVHEVTLSPYFLAKHECTQAQWEAMSGARPSAYHPGHRHLGKWLTPRNPVETVSWDECMAWLPRWHLTLPTEAQWECACRAGTYTPWWCGPEVGALEKVANLADQTCKNGFGQATWRYEAWDDGWMATAPVGSFAANPFGFFDVHGNVWEWCSDLYVDYTAAAVTDPKPRGPGSHVHRGGAWNFPSPRARSAHRNTTAPHLQSDRLGFRPARSVAAD
ncbi:MAG: formylglycine-generating enzyme family protein, partial [Planctomycetota bacterium]